jgi:hypothetical protein
MIAWLTSLRWNVLLPVAALAAALAAVLAFDLRTSGQAEPPKLVGALGSPVRGTIVPLTATPVGARPAVTPRPTVGGSVAGTPATRDVTRRNNLLIALDGFHTLKERSGSFPTTNGNIQTLCAYKEVDQGCKLAQVLPAGVPMDPLGDPLQNGFWYQSDGTYVKLYASLEQPVPPDQQCPTDNVDLKKKQNLICVTSR